MMLGRNIFKLRLSCLKSEPDSPRLAILASCRRRSRLLLVFGKDVNYISNSADELHSTHKNPHISLFGESGR